VGCEGEHGDLLQAPGQAQACTQEQAPHCNCSKLASVSAGLHTSVNWPSQA